jgi:hypothetical protein
MDARVSKQDIVRLLGINQLLYTKTAPTNPVTERTQKKSYAENGSNASLGPGDHLIVNLQTGTEFIDPLQSFLVFDLVVTGTAAPVASGSACNVIRDTQVSTRSGKEMDRMEQINLHNYHTVFNDSKEHSQHNLQGMMMAEVRRNPTAAQLAEGGGRTAFVFTVAGGTASITKRVMIPLKYVSPIFESEKLMPPHLARGLRVDCTLEAFATAFCSAEAAALTGVDPTYSYVASKPYILTDSYRMMDSVLAYINQSFASQKSGLVYEYFSYQNTKTQVLGATTLNLEVRATVAQAVSAYLVSRDSEADTIASDSFASLPISDADRSQWRIGSHYLPNAPIAGQIEHYTQSLYFNDRLRTMVPDGCDYLDFVGVAAAGGTVGSGAGKFPVVLSRNNIMELSGWAINNSMTLAADLTIASGGNRNVSVFLRHLRRAICFLESVQLEL